MICWWFIQILCEGFRWELLFYRSDCGYLEFTSVNQSDHFFMDLFVGKEHFPTVWPPEVLELFVVQVRGQIMITVQGFDGTFNLLKLTQLMDKGGNSINSCVLETLRKHPEKAAGEELSLQKQVCSKEGPQAGSASMAAGHASSDTEKPKPECRDMGIYLCRCVTGQVLRFEMM